MSSTLSYVEEVVPIEKLKEDEEFKNLVPPNNMKEQIASSIAKNGQTLPIDVDSDYVILDGYTRVAILKELKYKEVKVRKWNFRSNENRVIAYRLVAMLNLQRRHLEKNEVLRLLREIVEKTEKTAKSSQQQVIEQNKTEIKSEERQKFSPSGENFAQNNETNTKPTDLELKMKQVKEEIGAKEVTDSDIQKYSIISTIPFLRQLVDDGEISLRTAYELYTKAKDKLQKIANLPKHERDQLLTTREGRKIILERDDLLELILQNKMDVSQAIDKIKTEEKLEKSKKKSETKEEEEKKTEEKGEETKIVTETETKIETEVSSKPPEELSDLPIILRKFVTENKLGLEEARSLNSAFNNPIHFLQRAYEEGKITDDDVLALLTTTEGKEILTNYNGVYASLFMNILTGNKKVQDAIIEVRKSKEVEKTKETESPLHYVEVPVDAVIIRIRRNDKAIAVSKEVLLDIIAGNLDKYPDIKELFNKHNLIEDGRILWGDLNITPTEEIKGNDFEKVQQLSINEVRNYVTKGYGFVRINSEWYAVRADLLYRLYYAKQLSNSRKDLIEKVKWFKVLRLYHYLEDALIV